MHFSVSIQAGCFFCQAMASVGQALKQSPHFLQASASTSNFNNSTHLLAGHFFALIWASYSSRKYRRVDSTGFGAVCPSPHNAVSLITAESYSRASISPGTPCPSQILSSISSSRRVPSRQGVHLPHYSSWINSMKNRAISTIQVFSSMTITPPDPMIAPTLAISS